MTTTQQPYYIGLDMGTSSVGWAVTDEHYKVLRGKGKDMWGVRLFDEASTAADRRTFRVARRRRQRETARIGVVKEYFADALAAVDPGFLQRLDESKYYLEDRAADNQQPFGLFNDPDFTDKDYFKQYPTIFHLRKELIESTAPHDVRLVYLAVLNLFKRRGHFLNKSLADDGGTLTMAEAYAALWEEASAQEIALPLPETVDAAALERTLGTPGLSRKALAEQVKAALGLGKKDKRAAEVVALLCGLKGSVRKIFGDEWVDEEHKSLSLSFRDSDYEEKMLEVREVVGDENAALIDAAKDVHDIGLLSHILDGERYLSMARVKAYEAHHEDLQQLKATLKKYDRSAYYKMFREMGSDNYSAYVGSVNYKDNKQRRNEGKGKDSETFYKALKKVLAKLPADDPDVVDMLAKMDRETFLQKQLTASNGIIPNQVHARELKAILDNAAGYLPFLLEKDGSGLTVSERILQLYRFQIPYYVGPLGQQHSGEKGSNVWAKRFPGEEHGRIYPWNFAQKIDVEQAAQDFIERMVRRCTYLTNQRTLPKQSLMYEKFMVLNELNNLRIHGEKPDVAVKQEIYKSLFLGGKRVTRKKLLNHLVAVGKLDSADDTAISGIDQDIKASLSTLGKFKGIFGDDALRDDHRDLIENIVFWATIYGDDKRFLRNKITAAYGDRLTAQQIKRLCGMNFSGWGRLSKEFLELQGVSKADGEYRSLLQALWDTNDNLMTLLGQGYTYADELEKRVGDAEKPLSEWTIDDLDGMYLSPAVKRMVWQTLKVLRDIVAVRGYAPSKIFVEMARDDAAKRAQNKGKRTQSRKVFLLDAYKGDKEWCKAIESRDDADFRQKKLYLYYMQQGRCMYSGAPIDLDKLLAGNDTYDIDHIYPRHFVKDDSIENNLVLVKKTLNAHKSDTFPLEGEIRTSQYDFWKSLLDKGLITQQKFRRLTRSTAFTAEELAGFINRQLVETRQGTKALTQILQQAFPGDDTRVVFTKAGITADFRQTFDLPKARSVNNLHHAHDAYLNIVAGNVYDAKFTAHPLNFIKQCQQRGEYRYNMARMFDHTVQRGSQVVWVGEKDKGGAPFTIAAVKKQLARSTVLLTRRSFMAHGGITNKATIYGKGRAKADSYLPVKSSDPRLQDVTKYGGVTSILNTAYALVEYTVKGQRVRSLEAIPLYVAATSKDDPALYAYLQQALQMENKKALVEGLSVRLYPVRQRALVKLDGYYYHLGGMTGSSIYLLDAVPLYLSGGWVSYVKKIEKALERSFFHDVDKNGQAVLTNEKNQALYDLLVQKLSASIYKNKKCTIINTLVQGRDAFAALSLEQQCATLASVLAWMNTAQQFVDLQDIGGSAHSGMLRASKKLSSLSEALLIEQSATGLFEREIDLLAL